MRTSILNKFMETLGERGGGETEARGRTKLNSRINRTDHMVNEAAQPPARGNGTRPTFSYIVIKYPHLCAIFQSQVSRYVSLLWIDKVTNHQGTRALHSDIYTIPCPFIQIKQGNTQKKLASGLLDAFGTSKSEPFQSPVDSC